MYNYNYLNENWFKENDNLYRNIMQPSLFTPAIGYDNGNMFSNLYSQYKNYKPVTLTPTTEQDTILLELARMGFAAHELNLYLDLHPEDTGMLALFNDYREKTNQLTKQYESKFGPLNISSDSLIQPPFKWEKGVWPWEGTRYV